MALFIFSCYIIFTLPILALLVVNRHFRFTAIETVTHYVAKIRPLPALFVGNSITAGAGNWGIKLGKGPFWARNLAEDGRTLAQIRAITNRGLQTYHPGLVFLMTGTIDGTNGYDPTAYRETFTSLLDDIISAGSRPVVTLTPYTANPARIDTFTSIRRIEIEECERKGITVIDTAPHVAPQSVMLERFHIGDGIHFSQEAYGIWLSLLKSKSTSWLAGTTIIEGGKFAIGNRMACVDSE